jgi:hypothetical protein
MAAQGAATPALDVILTDPATEFSGLYRLVDVRIVREVRVTMPAIPGFMKALRLAAALQLRVRLLPGQPSAEALAELTEAAHFYLHDPMVETPVEFFHSLLATSAAWETARSGDFSKRIPPSSRTAMPRAARSTLRTLSKPISPACSTTVPSAPRAAGRRSARAISNGPIPRMIVPV